MKITEYHHPKFGVIQSFCDKIPLEKCQIEIDPEAESPEMSPGVFKKIKKYLKIKG